jgi:hypothetical protein
LNATVPIVACQHWRDTHKISTELSILTGILLALAVLITSTISLVIMYRELGQQAVQMQESRMKTFWELAAQKGKEFKLSDGKLMIDSYQPIIPGRRP